MRPNADGRRELLAWLDGRGVAIDAMVDAARQGQLNSVGGDLAIRPGPRLSPRELAARLDIDVQLVRDVRRASGLPAVGEDEPDAHRRRRDVVRDLQGRFRVLQPRRGAAVLHRARLVDATHRRRCGRDVPARRRGAAEGGRARPANSRWPRPTSSRSSSPGCRRTCSPRCSSATSRSPTQRTRLARRDSEDYETVPLAIGFVDLSGFTERSSSLTPTELRDLVVDFEMRANGIVGDHDGRVIKLIGDEVMFSAIDAEAGLLDRARAHRGSTRRHPGPRWPRVRRGRRERRRPLRSRGQSRIADRRHRDPGRGARRRDESPSRDLDEVRTSGPTPAQGVQRAAHDLVARALIAHAACAARVGSGNIAPCPTPPRPRRPAQRRSPPGGDRSPSPPPVDRTN